MASEEAARLVDLERQLSEAKALAEAHQRDARNFAEALDNIREVIGLEETHYLVLANDVEDALNVQKALAARAVEALRIAPSIVDEARMARRAEREFHGEDLRSIVSAAYLETKHRLQNHADAILSTPGAAEALKWLEEKEQAAFKKALERFDKALEQLGKDFPPNA